MSHKMLRPFIVKVSVLGYFPLHNYRPISQLTFVSKILEKIVSKQLINYLNGKLLFDPR